MILGNVFFLLIFLLFKWTTRLESAESGSFENFFRRVRVWPFDRLFTDMFGRRKVCDYEALLILFTSNFIGMCFSRGTHQQFYAWYSYSFPFLVDAAFGRDGSNPLTKFATIMCLEIAWSVAKPRSPLQSYLLNACHLAILVGLLLQKKTWAV